MLQGFVTMYEHLLHLENVFNETKILIKDIALTIKERDFYSKKGNLITSYSIDYLHPSKEKLIQNLTILYHENGIGFKLLSSILGNVSYTQLRTIFRKLNIESRKGFSCITESLKKTRSERAKKSNPWRNWTGSNLSTMHSSSKKFLGGWYFNKNIQRNVWLRSSWEYAYASFLDETNKEWNVEVNSFLLSDGTYYRPDFFIYEKNNLLKIVEIKSTWSNGSQNRIEKFEKFKLEYPQIKSELICDELFTLINRTQSQCLIEWKKIRKMEKEND
jgi:hypothetical protein